MGCNEESLTSDQRLRLSELLAANEALSPVYILKDQFNCAMRGRPTSAEESGIRLLMIFAWNLRHYEEGVVADARFPIHTGRLEDMHNKMKLIKRQAYGFRDDDYFILKIKDAFPGHLRPNWRRA